MRTKRLKRTKKIARYSLKPVKGEPLRTDLDNVAELIAEVEDDAYPFQTLLPARGEKVPRSGG
jgi:hypothetical protein